MLNVSLPPHITSRYRLKQLHSRKLVALLPLVFSALYLYGTGFLFCLLAGMAGYIIMPLIVKKWRRSFLNLAEALFSASVISLLMPVGTAWYHPLLAGLLISGAKNLLSEKDRLAPVNFTALVMALFILATPDGLNPVYLWSASYGGWAQGNFYFLTGWLPLSFSLMLLVLLTGRLYKTGIIVLTLLSTGVVITLNWLMAGAQAVNVISYAGLQALLFLAGILAVKNHYTPLTGWGRTIYGLLTGTVFALFTLKGLLYQGLIFSALTASLLTPFLDCLFTGGYRRTKV